MKFGDVVPPDAIRVGFTATTRESVFYYLIESLVPAGIVTDVDHVVRSLLKREQIGSTGVGNRFACPHFRGLQHDHCVIVVGIAAEGIEWDALDEESVRCIFLILSPKERPGDHLRALSLVLQFADSERRRSALQACRSEEEVFELLQRYDEGLGLD